MNGQYYHSSEQFIQAQKADYFSDIDTLNLIMKATTPMECKELARNITGFNHDSWKDAAKSHCKPGIEAKFMSNPYLVNMLQSTPEKMLIEACYDKLWGTGIPLRDRDCLKRDMRSNIGIQGEILMEIRSSLTTQYSTNYMETLPPSQAGDQNVENITGSRLQELTNHTLT